MIRDPINVRTINQARSNWPLNSVANVGTGAPPGFNPANLTGAIGVYDVSVLSSMTIGRDGSGGTPGIGDVVGTLADLSPAGNDLVAPSDAARPVLRQTVGGLYYLEHDGVDDRMSSGTIATVDAPIYIAAALEKGIEDSRRMPAIVQNASNWIGGLNVASAGRMQGLLRTTAFGVKTTAHGVDTFPIDTPTVTEVAGDGTNLVTQLNGGDQKTNAANPFGGFTNAIITTTENFLEMNFYGGVFRAGTANAGTDEADIRQWLADRSGATLV